VATLALLTALVLPRAFSHASEPPPDSVPLQVLTSNILVGKADLGELASLVRRERIDVLSVQELTPEADRELRRLLGDRLPHAATRPEPRTAGTGLYSRYRLRQRPALAGGRTSFRMARATMLVPSVGPVELAAVHPPPPTIGPAIVNWRHDLEALPRTDPNGRLHLLAGDFNATLDQAEMREVIDAGYVDAAYEDGIGLATTWPADRRFPPEVTIDHVLADERIAVLDAEIHSLAGSDHRPVSAELALPRHPGPR
jgi:endonuclease/exonuclease/phosphatase (EEP) superfamily protein YafD